MLPKRAKDDIAFLQAIKKLGKVRSRIEIETHGRSTATPREKQRRSSLEFWIRPADLEITNCRSGIIICRTPPSRGEFEGRRSWRSSRVMGVLRLARRIVHDFFEVDIIEDPPAPSYDPIAFKVDSTRSGFTMRVLSMNIWGKQAALVRPNFSMNSCRIARRSIG